MEASVIESNRQPWNKGKIVGQKAPFKVKGVWALRAHLKVDSRIRELASSIWESTASCVAVTLSG